MTEISLADLVVLVVELSSTQRRIICRALQDNDVHAIAACESGEQVLASPETEQPDLVISSLYLPDMARTDLVPRIRESAQHAATPFLPISS